MLYATIIFITMLAIVYVWFSSRQCRRVRVQLNQASSPNEFKAAQEAITNNQLNIEASAMIMFFVIMFDIIVLLWVLI